MSRKYSLYRGFSEKVPRGVHNLLLPGQTMFLGGRNALTSGDVRRPGQTRAAQKDWINA
jgi:hypothetical protein